MENKNFKILSLILCVFIVSSVILLYSADPQKIIKNTEIKIRPYRIINTLPNQYTIVEKNHKLGLRDEKGKIIIPIHYDNIKKAGHCYIVYKYLKNRHSSNIRPRYEGKYGLCNENGKMILPVRYNIIRFIKDKYIIALSENKNILFDETGSKLLEYEAISTENFKDENVFWVKKNGKWGRVNINNEILTNFIFDNCPDEIAPNIYMVQADEIITNEEAELDYKIQQQEERIKREESVVKEENLHKTIGELHCVNVYHGKYQNPRDGVQNHEIGDVTVNVNIVNKPVTLLLTSYEAVRWTIKAKPGAQIKKIYFSGYYDGEVITGNKNIPVERTSKRLDFGDNDRRKVSQYMDKAPSSYQYVNNTGDFMIDGIIGASDKYEFVKHQSTDKNVVFSAGEYETKTSQNGLALKYGGFGVHTQYRANKYYSNGKYYFEVTTQCRKNEKYCDSGFGIIYHGKNNSCIGYDERTCMSVPVLSKIDGKNINFNDTVGCAVDFDNGKIYISHNGKWINSMPDKGKTLYTFRNDGREYTIYADISQHDSLIFNLGAKKFKYEIPQGFQPYDTYSSNQ